MIQIFNRIRFASVALVFASVATDATSAFASAAVFPLGETASDANRWVAPNPMRNGLGIIFEIKTAAEKSFSPWLMRKK